MGKLDQIDRNMAVQAAVPQEGTVWRDARKPPFSLHGLLYENGAFRRMPETVARTVSPGVLSLHDCCSGGRVRFRTDSSFVSVRAGVHSVHPSTILSLTGTAGFDLYAGDRHVKAMRPPNEIGDGYESRVELEGKTLREIPILFMTRPRFVVNRNTAKRIEVVRRTYENARAAGDENVYLLTGPELMALAGCEGTVDAVHPDALGFYSMTQAVTAVLRPLLR